MSEGTLTVIRFEDYNSPPQREKGHTRIRITQADPKVRITDELLHDSRRPNPWVTVAGDRFEIADDYGNRYIYRIGEHDPKTNTHAMEWPD